MADLAAIRLKAYEIWETKGWTDGHDQDDWLEAESILAPHALTLEPAMMAGAETDPSFLDSIKDEIQVIADTAGKAVHYVEELLGLAPAEKLK